MGVIKPVKLLLLSFCVWLFVYVQIPVAYLYDGSAIFPILTLFLFILIFVFGIVSLKGSAIKPINKTHTKKLKQIVFFFFCIGVLGVLLKLYVGFFKTEIFVSKDIFEKRLENMGSELTGGGIGVLASLSFPFSFISLLIAVYNYKIFNKLSLFLIAVFGCYPFVETFFMGGRTIIALLGATLMFVILASFRKNSKLKLLNIKFMTISIVSIPKLLLKKSILIPVVIIATLFISYSSSVVNKRLTRFGYGDRTFQVWEQKDYRWVKIDKDFKEEFFHATKEDKNTMIGLYSLKHYFVHGVFEYIRLVNHLEKTTGYYYGQYEFNVFFKFFKFFGIPLGSFAKLNTIIERKAVYSTFWGPFYIDFGIFGIIIMFFWGRFVKRVYIHASRGVTPYVIFYGYLSTIIITSIFINFIMGSSSYYLFAFFVSVFIFKYWPNNLTFTLNK
jgi:hypothetical protein